MKYFEDEELMSEFLAESYENLDQLEKDLVLLEKEPTKKEILERIFRCIHTIKGTSGFLGLNKLETVAHTGENLLSRLRDGKVLVSPPIISVLLSLIDALRKILNLVEKTKSEGEEDFSSLLESLVQLSKGEAPAVPVQTSSPQPTAETPKKEENHDTSALSNDSSDPTIRVRVDLLDRLMNLVGELVLARNQILQFATKQENLELTHTSQRLNLITTELQESVMKTRMQPINNVWSKLPRVVRDLATTCGKKVEIAMEGKETELDKTLIEAIRDPLTHMVRNSIDHGIESPEIREKSGKTATGHLLLRAFHEGGQVNIEITDDGGGLDAEKIKKKAIERGIFTAAQVSQFREKEIFNLICLPGFSTAEKVTNVSGRGVGMDVVKTNIERIGGSVDIQSQLGKGTTFRIKIPLTLAIIPALMVKSGVDRFAIPQVSLLELVRLEGEEAKKGIEHVKGAAVYRLRGNLLPLVFLKDHLTSLIKQEEVTTPPSSETLNIVVLQADGHPFGLVVDDVINTQEIVVKPLGKQLKGISCYAGATIMGDGRVSLILDVFGLAQKVHMMFRDREPTSFETKQSDQQQSKKTETLLLFSTLDGKQVSIPLSKVYRLEEFSTSSIEKSGARSVVQYRGKIMPLINSPLTMGQNSTEERNSYQVIVTSISGHDIGVIVDRILDIVDEEIKVHRDYHNDVLMGSAVIRGKITDILDIQSVIRSFDPELLTQNEQAQAA